jgi:Trypsin-like peptidase domain
MRSWMFCLLALFAGPVFAQVICKDGKCQLAGGVVIAPLQEEVFIDASTLQAATTESDADRLNRIIRATVRVTVSGVCGSGTVVGRDGAGNAIVLTNAHVAGTQKGRIVQLERWDQDGKSERGQGAIIASGYGRGMSVDFALLKCNTEFAKDVVPIPLADRYPKTEGGLTTYGCPRCEWPSLQVLKLNRSEGQILTWKPEAIGGRSGSSVIDYTEAGPRVVGLLTWGGGGEGLGQSTPFLLQAMRGRLPQALESLPPGVREVPCFAPLQTGNSTTKVAEVPAMVSADDETVVDSITEEGIRRKPKAPKEPDNDRTDSGERPLVRLFQFLWRSIITLFFAVGAGIAGYFLGRLSK